MKTSDRLRAALATVTAIPLAIVLGLTSSSLQPVVAEAVPLVSLTSSFEFTPEANSPSPELSIVVQINTTNAVDEKLYGLQVWVSGPGSGQDWSFSKALTACNNLANPTTQDLASCDIEITRTRAGVTEPLQLNGISYPLSCCLNLGTAQNYAGATNTVLVGDTYNIKLAAGALSTTGVGADYSVKAYVTGFRADNTNFGFLGQSSNFEIVAAGTREAQLRAAARRFVTVTSVDPIKILTRKQIVTIDGANLDSVSEVLIDGTKSTVLSKAATQLKVLAPQGPVGLVDLELKSPLNDVLLVGKLDYGSPAYSKRKEVLVIRGFAMDSNILSKAMKQKIKKWLANHGELGTLSCKGFTSLPRKATDVALSTQRGRQACNFAKTQSSSIEILVRKGIEDPRPGSNVRRVRLVLTP